MEPLLIAISSITLLLLIAVSIWLLYSNKNKSSGNNFSKELNILDIRSRDTNEKLINLEKTLLLSLTDLLKKEFTDLNKILHDNAEKSLNHASDRYKEQNEILTKSVDKLNETLEKKLTEINGKVNERLEKGFEDVGKTFTDVMKSIARIEEAKKKMEELTVQVIDLQGILSNNQSRGQFGEWQLVQILDSVFEGLKDLYSLQHRIYINEDKYVIADAVVFMKDSNRMICIDSKFPLSNYQAYQDTSDEKERSNLLKDFKNDVKKHIKDISEKYVIPGQTFSQAFMFLPSDGLLAFIHQEATDLIIEAQRKNVMMVSPATLLPTLAAIRNINITVEKTKQVEIIQKQLIILSGDFKKFGDDWSKFVDNLSRAMRGSDALDKRVQKITKDFTKINRGYLLPDEAGAEEEDGLTIID